MLNSGLTESCTRQTWEQVGIQSVSVETTSSTALAGLTVWSRAIVRLPMQVSRRSAPRMFSEDEA